MGGSFVARKRESTDPEKGGGCCGITFLIVIIVISLLVIPFLVDIGCAQVQVNSCSQDKDHLYEIGFDNGSKTYFFTIARNSNECLLWSGNYQVSLYRDGHQISPPKPISIGRYQTTVFEIDNPRTISKNLTNAKTLSSSF